MLTFEELYKIMLKESIRTGDRPAELPEHDPGHLDCLLYPERYPLVIQTGGCECAPGEAACRNSCLFDAIVPDDKGGYTVDESKCTGCAACVEACRDKKLRENTSVLSVLYALKNAKAPVYALIAPSFLGQWSEEVTPGKLRSAFKKLGFTGMLEVALFADILTLKEALEFDRNILTESDFQLTSCCCPIWIAMIRKTGREFLAHVPGAVSPMVACGRTVKHLHPDAVTVFIGPCMAKKAEAREEDIADAVDFVLTFQEMRDIFEMTGIDPSGEEESEKDHSSRAGRIYARAGGVSEAVKSTVERLSPYRSVMIRTRTADGVPKCREMIEELKSGRGNANFYEGMGCVGGCVGGPKAVIDREEGRRHVERYGDDATYLTPLENPYVVELLHRLGLDTVESLLAHSDLFTRRFI